MITTKHMEISICGLTPPTYENKIIIFWLFYYHYYLVEVGLNLEVENLDFRIRPRGHWLAVVGLTKEVEKLHFVYRLRCLYLLVGFEPRSLRNWILGLVFNFLFLLLDRQTDIGHCIVESILLLKNKPICLFIWYLMLKFHMDF